MNQIYEPYEELRAEFLAHECLLRLHTPWTVAEADVKPESAEAVAHACEGINNFKKGAGNVEVSELLSVFKEHNFAYLAPRRMPLAQEHCSRTKAGIRRSAKCRPESWVDSYIPTIAHAIGSMPDWDFDMSECLGHSRIDGESAFDPSSAYRFIMHWVFVRMTGSLDVYRRFLDLMEKLLAVDEQAFFRTAKFALRQYHHVTSTSFECLLPALHTIDFAKSLIHKLVHEEQGHGRYTAESLRKLGVERPSSLPLLPEPVGIMDLLRITTSLNPLAFACLFSVFELAGEQDEDPLAALLARSSIPDAANGIRAHFDFNRAGAHFTSGILLLDEMGGVDAHTVIEAARIVELYLMFAEGLGEKCLEYGRIAHAGDLANAS